MADTVSDFLVKRLSHWGVRRMNELITAAKYWRYWDDLRLIVLVLNNCDLISSRGSSVCSRAIPSSSLRRICPTFPMHAGLLGSAFHPRINGVIS